ncbi:Predicted N-acetyltransferase YhbS [Chitinophaga jiangningensis]|uniref:Predicted N-acetyltransferase YhbS n=1 Tax=Chitinophaga jiangningensis TaxID=1419482 RepID=A0A1M6YT89_9BACT|nr:N-acetyltransferase [Chitinophaga jiangningensis]SHL21259.1 Predicted N-acetyltransferase YhbS [Chitinophaga jiangningensis]
MQLHIRPETSNDYNAVFDLVEDAFKNEAKSDHQEQFLVERLRKSAAFMPQLSLVAEADGQLVGYILLTKIKIVNDKATAFEALALAPVAVLQRYQGKGIGAALIQAAHLEAQALDYKAIVLLGHADYYPKFGYRKASEYGIRLPFDVPDENCMVIELATGALQGVTGTVEYPAAFFE